MDRAEPKEGHSSFQINSGQTVNRLHIAVDSNQVLLCALVGRDERRWGENWGKGLLRRLPGRSFDGGAPSRLNPSISILFQP
jgi:hypothetical protein